MIEKEFKDAVWKQGFSLEQNVFRILEKDGWTILPNRNFFDLVNNITREFDLLAVRETTKANINFFTVLIIECKYNPHRIVFYTRQSHDRLALPQLYIGDFIKKFIPISRVTEFFANLKQHKDLFRGAEQIFGYQVFEKIEKQMKVKRKEKTKKEISFKSRQEFAEKLIFGAINTAIQATMYEQRIRDRISNAGNFLMYFPVVIFADELYEARLLDRNVLKKQDLFRYRSGMTSSSDESPSEFDVYVCKISALPRLLKVFNYTHQKFSSYLFKSLNPRKK